MSGGANHSRLTSMAYASGYVVTYNYGSGLDSTISRLTSLSDSSNTLESNTYLGLGAVVKRAHPQSGVDLSYIKVSGESTGDAGDQYTGLDRFGRIVDQRWINASNADVDRFRYGYDRDGNRTYKENVVNTGLSEIYTNDDLGQIASYKLGTLNTGKTDVTGTPTNSQSWDYDATGNWDSITINSTTQTRSANKQNEITSVSGATTPTYDNNGNLTKDENNYRFVYDAWNRQVKIKDSSDTVITTNSFNGINEKIKVVAGSTTIDRIFSKGWQLLEEKSGSNTVTRNVWSPTYLDAIVLRDRDTDANGTLDERLFPTQDANFNVTAILNTSGTVQEKYNYTPFGVVTYRNASGDPISSSNQMWVFLFQGGQIDVTGHYDFRNRELSPTLGRWLTNDPLGFSAGDVNTYRYVENGPISLKDPLGLGPWDFGVGLLEGGVTGLIVGIGVGIIGTVGGPVVVTGIAIVGVGMIAWGVAHDLPILMDPNVPDAQKHRIYGRWIGGFIGGPIGGRIGIGIGSKINPKPIPNETPPPGKNQDSKPWEANTETKPEFELPTDPEIKLPPRPGMPKDKTPGEMPWGGGMVKWIDENTILVNGVKWFRWPDGGFRQMPPP